MTEMTLRRAYWTATLLFLVPQLYNAGQMLEGAPFITNAITALGYPLYFVRALAIAKLLGAAAICYDRSRTLKEWAYAGYTFEVLAAFVSEVAVEGSPLVALIVLLFLGLLLVSYGCWKRMITRHDARGSDGMDSPSTTPGSPPLAVELAPRLASEHHAGE